MIWQINQRGFLPAIDPVMSMPHSLQCVSLFFVIENLGATVPDFNDHRQVRYELVAQLRAVGEQFTDELVNGFSEAEAERMFLLFGYFATTFIYARGENSALLLPKEIAVPLFRLANRLNRQPVLSYSSYCLFNWSAQGSFDPEYMVTLLNFSRQNKQSEDEFSLVNVAIEEAASPVIRLLYSSPVGPASPPVVENVMTVMQQCLERMLPLAKRLSHDPRTHLYTHGVNRVVYQGCYGDEPQTMGDYHRLPLSLIALFAALGVPSNGMIACDRNALPVAHRDFLARMDGLGENSCRQGTVTADSLAMKSLYNECLASSLAFYKAYLHANVSFVTRWDLQVGRMKL